MVKAEFRFVDEKAKLATQKVILALPLICMGTVKLVNSVEENTALMTPFMKNREMMQSRVQAGFEAIKQIPNADISKVVAIGYCFGGLCVQDLARVNSDVKGVVSVHGLMKQAPNISQGLFNSKVLLLHGSDDPMVSDDDWVALRKNQPSRLRLAKTQFGGVMHAFTNPQANDKEMGTVYNESANNRTEKLIADFIEECF
ncbi:MAG: dienelactone hydrolase family protein [Gammaproteobacteria bacterium]